MVVLSIMWSLSRWIDLQTRDRQQEIRRLREVHEDDSDGDDPPENYVLESAAPRAARVILFRCRVCDFTADHKRFCPTCLADSLVAQPRPRRDSAR